jgi:hypothetical protein
MRVISTQEPRVAWEEAPHGAGAGAGRPRSPRRGRIDLLRRVRSALPEGNSLPDSTWRARHRGILIVLWLHSVGIVVFGVLTGHSLLHSVSEGSIVAMEAATHRRPAPCRVRGKRPRPGHIVALGSFVKRPTLLPSVSLQTAK